MPDKDAQRVCTVSCIEEVFRTLTVVPSSAAFCENDNDKKSPWTSSDNQTKHKYKWMYDRDTKGTKKTHILSTHSFLSSETSIEYLLAFSCDLEGLLFKNDKGT